MIGNQGVGKNKIADRLLQLLCLEREYMQLHRDTTVQSLTVSPVLRHGVIEYQDSPLVKAVEHGRTLVLDEADKAPLEVVSLLKVRYPRLVEFDSRSRARFICCGVTAQRVSSKTVKCRCPMGAALLTCSGTQSLRERPFLAAVIALPNIRC